MRENMRLFKILVGLMLAATLAACGGGGGSAGATGTTVPGAVSGDGTTAPTVASYSYEVDKLTVTNSGSDHVTLTVTALSAGNNPVAGASLAVAMDSGVYTPTTSTTDANGKVQGVITVGANKANRRMNATMTLGGISKVLTLEVTGSQITVTPVPVTPAPGSVITLNIKASDSASNGLGLLVLQLSGTAGFTGSVTTDSSGNVSLTGPVPVAPGTYSIEVAGSGVSVTKVIQVAAAGSGTIPPAVGTVSAASLSLAPNAIQANPTGTANRSRLSAKFLTAANAGIQNIRVRFQIVPPQLGSGEFISTGDSFVYTDAAGVAEADYVAGTRSSPTNGVVIRACYSDSDFVAGACPNQVQTTLTVNGQPLDVSIGDDNKQAKGLGGISYIKMFLIQVADSAGVAVPGAVVSASVDITHYAKGSFTTTTTYQVTGNIPPTINNTYTNTFNASSVPSVATGRVWCLNEDLNRNGSFDTGEDFDLNGRLEPRKSEIVLSYVSGNTTDSNGQLLIQVLFPQNMATWLAYTVKASTTVTGSEGTNQRSFITNALEEDVENGSFLTPPFGVGSCQQSF
jgi:hypothetical protein